MALKTLTGLFLKNSSCICKSQISSSLYFSTSRVKKPTVVDDIDIHSVSEFLIQKHHFSPQAASQVSPVLTHLRNPQKSDSILLFLKENGFSNSHLAKVLRYSSGLLSANLDKIVKPKIKIFQDLGFSADETADIITNGPSVLFRSANNRIIPSLSVLKGLLGSNAQVAKLLKKSGWFLIVDLEKTMMPNIEFLKKCGIQMDQIISLLHTFPRFFLHKPESMRRFVAKADEMGVERSSRMFIHATRIVSSMTEESWERKLKMFRNFGFSDDDMLKVFKNVPVVLSVSKRKIEKIKEFLIETGKYDLSCVTSRPTLLMYSVEKRYKPRLRVVEILEKKNLIKKQLSLATIMVMSHVEFLQKFVAPHMNEVGDVYIAKSMPMEREMKCLKEL